VHASCGQYVQVKYTPCNVAHIELHIPAARNGLKVLAFNISVEHLRQQLTERISCMSSNKRAIGDQWAQADRAAKVMPHKDIISLITPCPSQSPEIFVVPVRYALGEEKASHACCIPGVTAQRRPMAARRLRPGFLYLWQQQGPLKRYAIAANGLLSEQRLEADATVLQVGTLAGLALKKHHDAWMLYCEYPMTLEHCKSLSDSSSKRGAHMRHVALSTVANELQAPHCPPLASADQVIAELMPAIYALLMGADQKRRGAEIDVLGASAMQAPTTSDIRAYPGAKHRSRERENVIVQSHDASSEPPGGWSAERWDGQSTQDWLDIAKAQARGMFPVFTCLDDDLGVLRDIDHEQQWIDARYKKNSVRLSIEGHASFGSQCRVTIGA
jgi:hypothetical protein